MYVNITYSIYAYFCQIQKYICTVAGCSSNLKVLVKQSNKKQINLQKNEIAIKWWGLNNVVIVFFCSEIQVGELVTVLKDKSYWVKEFLLPMLTGYLQKADRETVWDYQSVSKQNRSQTKPISPNPVSCLVAPFSSVAILSHFHICLQSLPHQRVPHPKKPIGNPVPASCFIPCPSQPAAPCRVKWSVPSSRESRALSSAQLGCQRSKLTVWLLSERDSSTQEVCADGYRVTGYSLPWSMRRTTKSGGRREGRRGRKHRQHKKWHIRWGTAKENREVKQQRREKRHTQCGKKLR